mmetsp:Transcript_178752/g.572928  ORF Transcript_178752/g.572928 Transcript_178752/m.572928 type:complete len:239 (+) Transcript_178752:122-838(+)
MLERRPADAGADLAAVVGGDGRLGRHAALAGVRRVDAAGGRRRRTPGSAAGVATWIVVIASCDSGVLTDIFQRCRGASHGRQLEVCRRPAAGIYVTRSELAYARLGAATLGRDRQGWPGAVEARLADGDAAKRDQLPRGEKRCRDVAGIGCYTRSWRKPRWSHQATDLAVGQGRGRDLESHEGFRSAGRAFPVITFDRSTSARAVRHAALSTLRLLQAALRAMPGSGRTQKWRRGRRE